MEKANYPCDLHCHTNRSDGNDTPEEVVRHAANRGVRVLALTDHDVRPQTRCSPDGRITDLTAYALSLGVRLIPGIEISCETDIDDVHVVGLWCDWSDPWFLWLEEFTVKSKVEGYKELVHILNESGYFMTWEEILNSRETPISEDQIQKKYIFEWMAGKGYVNSWKEGKLLVKGTSRFNIRREKPEADEVIGRIHAAGGLAILAHPYLINEHMIKNGREIDRETFINQLFESGLDGIEACYTYEKTSYHGSMTQKEIEQEIIRKYGRSDRIISGGSDYHGDGKKGVKNPREVGECGISMEAFETIIAKRRK